MRFKIAYLSEIADEKSACMIIETIDRLERAELRSNVTPPGAAHDVFQVGQTETGSCGGREPADYCSREGALALKGMIEAYWRGRGQHVMIILHNVGFHPAIRTARFDVRSDLVDGMPRATASMRGVNGADFAKPPVVNREDLGPNDVRQAVRDS